MAANRWRLHFSAIGIVCIQQKFAAQAATMVGVTRRYLYLENSMSKKMINPLTLTIGAALLGAVGMANAGSFALNDLGTGYMQVGEKGTEGKCGEGKCGEKAAAGKAGEKAAEGKCGEKAAEGKCGEGKCGEKAAADKAGEKAAEGKCGEGKCGEKKAAEATCGEKKEK